MVHLTRRRFLAGAGVAAATTLSLSGYATAYETGSALTLAEYAPRLPNWPQDLELKIAVIADIHACYPWMSEERVGDIVDLANAPEAGSHGAARRLCLHPSVRFGLCAARRLGRATGASRGAARRLRHSRQSRLVVGGDSDRSPGRLAQRSPGARRGRRSSARKSIGAIDPAWAALLADRSRRLAGAIAARAAWARRRRSQRCDARNRRRRAGDPSRSRAFLLSLGSQPDRFDPLGPHARRAGQPSDHRLPSAPSQTAARRNSSTASTRSANGG